MVLFLVPPARPAEPIPQDRLAKEPVADHTGLIRAWDDKALRRGEAISTRV